jgi:hypothetical protein
MVGQKRAKRAERTCLVYICTDGVHLSRLELKGICFLARLLLYSRVPPRCDSPLGRVPLPRRNKRIGLHGKRVYHVLGQPLAPNKFPRGPGGSGAANKDPQNSSREWPLPLSRTALPCPASKDAATPSA